MMRIILTTTLVMTALLNPIAAATDSPVDVQVNPTPEVLLEVKILNDCVRVKPEEFPHVFLEDC